MPVVAGVAVVGFLIYERDTGGKLVQEMRTRMGEPDGGRSRPRHVIPAGYVGWMTVRYEVPGAPPLREEAGVLHLVYPDDGRIETSTGVPRSARQEFYYRDGEDMERLEVTWMDRTGMIWGLQSQTTIGENDDGTETRVSALVTFFVGTHEQYENTSRPYLLDPLAPAIPPALPSSGG